MVPSGVVSVVGCQVCPPSVETSTPATTPPPESVAEPVIVTALPSAIVLPDVGLEIVDVGGVVSVDAVAATSPDSSVAGWAPIIDEQVDRELLHVRIRRDFRSALWSNRSRR